MNAPYNFILVNIQTETVPSDFPKVPLDSAGRVVVLCSVTRHCHHAAYSDQIDFDLLHSAHMFTRE